MLMIAPSGGDSFTGVSGSAYNIASLVSAEIGGADVRQALLRNWTPTTYPLPTVTLTPLTGFTYTVPNNVGTLIITPAGTLATGTVTMPANPLDNQLLRVSSSQTITALTVSANAGQSISGAPTTTGATAPFEYIYNAANTTWYRR